MNELKPMEAVNLLDGAVSQLQVKREVHVQLQQAVEVLRKLAQSKPKESAKKPAK